MISPNASDASVISLIKKKRSGDIWYFGLLCNCRLHLPLARPPLFLSAPEFLKPLARTRLFPPVKHGTAPGGGPSHWLLSVMSLPPCDLLWVLVIVFLQPPSVWHPVEPPHLTTFPTTAARCTVALSLWSNSKKSYFLEGSLKRLLSGDSWPSHRWCNASWPPYGFLSLPFLLTSKMRPG